MRTAFLAAGWLATRWLVISLLLGRDAWVNGDVGYFASSLDQAGVQGLAHTLVEYPLPAVAVLAVPRLLAEATGQSYQHALIAMAVLTDLGFAGLLRWGSGPRWLLPSLTWLLAVPLVGATAYARFDLLPGVLVGAAVLLLATRPRVALGAAAVATGVKLWPALLLPGLLAAVRRPRASLAVLLGVGVVLADVTVVLAGWGRLVTPLTYQVDRGLQIESVAATPAMLLWWRDPTTWPVGYAASKAYEVSGPGVPLLLAATTVAVAVLGAALAGAWWWAWRRARPLSPDTAVWLSLAAVTGFMVTGKVLSPQYLLWLLPAAAAGLAVTTRTRARLVAWTGLLLVATLLTQLVFPTWYAALTLRQGHVGLTVALLALRNLLMLVLLAVAARETVRGLRHDGRPAREAPRGEAPEPARPVGGSPLP